MVFWKQKLFCFKFKHKRHSIKSWSKLIAQRWMNVDKNSPSEGDQNAASYVSDKQILQ